MSTLKGHRSGGLVHNDSAVAQDGAQRHPSPVNDAPKLLYTVAEAAQLLSLSRAHLYREIQCGALESLLANGRCRRISRAALEAYVTRLEQDAGNIRSPQ